MISAREAWAITEDARRPVSAWDKLQTRIKEAATKGKEMVVFDEEQEGVRFENKRESVKTILEDMGYEVSYRRKRDAESYNWAYGESYHNVYNISWRSKI